MDETKEIVCLQTTINIFRAWKIFPGPQDRITGKGFYVKYGVVCILTSVVFSGTLSHLIHTVKSKEYNHVDLDLSNVLSMIGANLLNAFFFVNVKSAVELYTSLSDFKEFGKPTKFDYVNERLNKLSKYHLYYTVFINALFVLASNIFRTRQCEEENLDNGLHEVCGLVTFVWLPFDIDYFPVKHICALLQILSIYHAFTPAAIVTFAIMETVLHVAVRFDHIKDLFVNALNEENSAKRRNGFNIAVKYHIRILELEDKLNNSFSFSVFSLLLLDAAIMGCGAAGFLKGGSPNPLAVCVAWFMGLMVICVSGQHLTNKSLSVGDAVYNTNWYNAEASLQRSIVIVLARCMKPMHIRAAAFGMMNHATIVTVLQASFSYIRLLTANDDN